MSILQNIKFQLRKQKERVNDRTEAEVMRKSKPERNIKYIQNMEMEGGSYRLACYSLVPWRSRGPLDTLKTEGSVSSENTSTLLSSNVHQTLHTCVILHSLSL